MWLATYCSVEFRNFTSCRFLENHHSFAQFPSSYYFSILKKICESQIFHSFLTSFFFWMFLLSQTFVISNTEKVVIFYKTFRNLKFSTFTKLWEFSLFIKSFFNSNVRSSQDLEALLEILKIFHRLYFRLFLQFLQQWRTN